VTLPPEPLTLAPPRSAVTLPPLPLTPAPPRFALTLTPPALTLAPRFDLSPAARPAGYAIARKTRVLPRTIVDIGVLFMMISGTWAS
jgi:hypothetical protein